MSLLAQAAAQATVREEAIHRRHITTDAGTQARVQLNEGTISDYADLLRICLEEGAWPFPPVEVVREETNIKFRNYLTDGFHRIEAANQVDWPHPIPALVRPGSQRDAILAAVGANANHGLRRTNADKRRAVEMLLKDEEWRTWSDRAIADQTQTTHPFVADVRRKLYPTPAALLPLAGNRYQSTAQSTARKGKDGRTIDTSRIGNGRAGSSQNGKATPTPPSPDPEILPVYVAGWIREQLRRPGHPDLTTYAAAEWAVFLEGIHKIEPSYSATRQALATIIQEQGDDDTSRPTRFARSLALIAGTFAPTDERLWADATGNTRMSDLRHLVTLMITDLAE